MKAILIMLIITLLCKVQASEESESRNEVEPRGKAKYALITNLAIVLAAKVGLYNLIVAIALTVASVKILLIMVWALTIYKHVPDPYLHYKRTENYSPYQDQFAHHREGYQALDLIADFIKKRQGLHFFYVVATKLIVLKMVYGALFYILVTKGWQFVLWFIHYLKKHKHDHHEYIEDHHFDHYDHGHYDHSYGPLDHSYGPPSHSYGSSDHIYGPSDLSYGSSDHSYGYADHQPYAYDKYGSKKKKIYDSDGSYAVKGH